MIIDFFFVVSIPHPCSSGSRARPIHPCGACFSPHPCHQFSIFLLIPSIFHIPPFAFLSSLAPPPILLLLLASSPSIHCCCCCHLRPPRCSQFSAQLCKGPLSPAARALFLCPTPDGATTLSLSLRSSCFISCTCGFYSPLRSVLTDRFMVADWQTLAIDPWLSSTGQPQFQREPCRATT